MNRRRRRSLISRLVFACAVLLMWLSSYAREIGGGRYWHATRPGWFRSVRIVSSAGGISLFDVYSSQGILIDQMRSRGIPLPPAHFFLVNRPPLDPEGLTAVPQQGRRSLGFAHRYVHSPQTGERHEHFRVPYWPFALAAIPWVASAWGRHPRSELLCPSCGYDLRATPEKCPECGATPTAPATAAL